MNTSQHSPPSQKSTPISGSDVVIDSPLGSRCGRLPSRRARGETEAMKRPARSKRSRLPTKARSLWKRALIWVDGHLATRRVKKLSERINALTHLVDACRKLLWSILKLWWLVSLTALSMHLGSLWPTSQSQSLPFKSSAVEQLGISKDLARLLWRRLGGS